MELAILSLNIHKHFVIDNKRLIVSDDIEISIIIFSLYLLFLRSINKSFYEIYFVDLLK